MKIKGGHHNDIGMCSYLKSINQFTNDNAEIEFCKLEYCNAHLIKIGDASESPRVLCTDHKKCGLRKLTKLKDCYRKVIKLIRMHLNKTIHQILADDITSTHKKIPKRKPNLVSKIESAPVQEEICGSLQ